MENLRNTFSKERIENPNLVLVEMDVSDSRDIEVAFQNLELRNICIDVLINNAGYGLTGFWETISDDELLKQFETNVFGLVEVTRKVLPSMQRRNKGKIINIGSVLGRFSVPWNGAYSASKFAVEGFSESLRYEMHGTGISVTIIEPGLINTNFKENQIESVKVMKGHTAWVKKTLRNLRGEGSDPMRVANLVVRIIKNRNPRLRYIVGWDARTLIFLKNILPAAIFEHLVRKFTMN